MFLITSSTNLKKIFISSDHAGFRLKEYIMVIDNVAKHMPADGSVWITNNTKYHNAFNGGEENRIHLVACVLDYKFN